MAMAIYMIRREENGEYAVYDSKTGKPAEVDGKRCINLKLNEALDQAETLNRA